MYYSLSHGYIERCIPSSDKPVKEKRQFIGSVYEKRKKMINLLRDIPFTLKTCRYAIMKTIQVMAAGMLIRVN